MGSVYHTLLCLATENNKTAASNEDLKVSKNSYLFTDTCLFRSLAIQDTEQVNRQVIVFQLMQKLQLKSRENFRKLYLVPALEKSLIIMSVPDKPTSRNQSYIRK